MREQQLYIYAIIETDTRGVNADQRGNFLRKSASSLRKSAATPCDLVGLNNQALNFIPYKELLVAATNIAVDSFADARPEELTNLVSAHERVNEALIRSFNVVPLRFGTIVENKEKLFDFLEKTYPRFLNALEKIDGKAEFIVEASWDEERILEEIMKENPEIQKLKEKVKARGSIFGLSAKVKLGKLIFENLDLRRKQYTADLLNFLKNQAVDFREGKRREGVIMSYSFLIEKSREADFESRLNKLAEKYQNKLRFKYIGPMAPYSFANIAFALADDGAIISARKALGVSKEAAWPEIKIAYHNLAVQHHPDKHGGSQEAGEKTKEIIAAYKTLEKAHDKSMINQ